MMIKIKKKIKKRKMRFRHCQHCRADAAGIPGGTDVSRQLYIRPVTLENTFSHG